LIVSDHCGHDRDPVIGGLAPVLHSFHERVGWRRFDGKVREGMLDAALSQSKAAADSRGGWQLTPGPTEQGHGAITMLL
jgi:hypothetical protein